MSVDVLIADYHNLQHQRDILNLLDGYARDPMGGGEPLAESTKLQLVPSLAERPFAFSILAYVDGQPAGLTNCFEGFSTFACKPLINIHDLVVASGFRGQQISQRMLQKVEDVATGKGCCKVTLEVLSNNTVAKSAYQKFGFAGYELDPEAGQALFWQKAL